MPTRFYLPSAFGPAAPVSPAFSAEWEDTASADSRKCVITKTNSLMEVAGYSESNATSPYDMLRRQYVSDPIRAQTISGTVKGQIRCAEDALAADFCRAIVINVVSGDGSVVRGTLLSHFPASLVSEYIKTTNLPAAMENRYFPPSSSVTSVVAEEGDRIVIEIGTRAFNAKTTTYTASHHLGDAAATDLPEDETSTDTYNPWVELSQTIFFSYSAKFTEDLSAILVSEKRIMMSVRRMIANLWVIRAIFTFVFIPVIPIYRLIQNLSIISDVPKRTVIYTRRFIENLSVLKDVFSFIYAPVVKVYRLVQTLPIHTFLVRRLSYLRTLRQQPFTLDVFRRVVAYFRVWKPTVPIRAVLRRLVGFPRRMTQNLSVIATILRRRIALTRPLKQAIIIQEVFKRVASYLRTFKETVVVRDLFKRIQALTRRLTQMPITFDVFKRVVAFPRKMIQNLSVLSTVFVRRFAIARKLTQIFLVQDVYRRIQVLTRRLRQDLSMMQDVYVRKINYLRRLPQFIYIKDKFSFIYVPIIRVYRFVQSLIISMLFQRRVDSTRRLRQDLSSLQDVFSYIYTPLIRVYRFIQTMVISTLIQRKVSLVRSVRQDLYMLQEKFSFIYTPIIRVYRFIQNLSSIGHIFRYELVTPAEEVIRRKFAEAQTDLLDLYEKAKKKAKFYLGR